MPKLPAPPPRRCSRRPSGRARTTARRRPSSTGTRARRSRRRLDRRAHLALGRRALDDVPQGPQGDQLVLHAGLGDDVRLPLPGGHRRLPGDVLRPVARSRAYESIRYITNEVFLGEFVHGMHKWGSSVMVILIFLHMGRTFFFGAYKYPRELNWVIGVALLILTMAMSFTGYLLPFDQRSYWATIVGVNINGTGPLVGPYLVGLPARRPGLRRDDAVALLRDPHDARARASSRRSSAPTCTSSPSSAPRRRRGCGPRRPRRCARTRSPHEQAGEGAVPPRVLDPEVAGQAVLPVRGRQGRRDGRAS